MGRFFVLYLIMGMYFFVHPTYTFSQNPNVLSADLPVWVFSLQRDSLTPYVLGVSDPFLKQDVALNQAKIRAGALLALSEEFRYGKMSAFYKQQTTTNKYGAKYTIILLFSAQFDTIGTEVQKLHFSKYDECFLLLSKKGKRAGKVNKMFSIEASYSYLENKTKDFVRSGVLNFRIINKKTNETLFYSKYFINNRIEIVSSIGNEIVPQRSRKFRYEGICPAKPKSKVELVTEYLGNSFWCGYITAIVRAIAFEPNLNGEHRGLSDMQTNKVQNVTIDINEEHYSFFIEQMFINDNNLSIKATIDIKQ